MTWLQTDFKKKKKKVIKDTAEASKIADPKTP